LGGVLHQGGPIWPNWEQQDAARFNRYGRPVDDLPQPVSSRTIEKVKHGIWIGPVFPQFGHAVADFATRVLFSTNYGSADMPYLISRGTTNISSIDALPRWLQSVYQWLGLELSRIKIISDECMVENLSVFPQGEQLGCAPTEHYLDILEENCCRQGLSMSEPKKTIYVSRSNHSPTFAGEIYFERQLQNSGVFVLHPEKMELRDQIQAYLSGSHLIFAEGSAIHGLQLLGRLQCDVTVLVRRSGNKLARQALKPRSNNLEYIDFNPKIICGLLPNGAEATHRGMAFIKPDKLIEWGSSLGVLNREMWCHSEFVDAAQRDLDGWLNMTKKDRVLGSERSQKFILNSIRKINYF
jgi:hypothetical protein